MLVPHSHIMRKREHKYGYAPSLLVHDHCAITMQCKMLRKTALKQKAVAGQ